jgi:pimeloyl-ACP methyl ester carboxylesterase
MSNFDALLVKLAAGRSPWKLACRTASTSNITLSGEQLVSAVSVVDGDDVLVTGQTDATQNGPYVASTGRWARRVDADRNNYIVVGMTVRVLGGSCAGTWVLSSPTTGTIRIGSTSLEFSQLDAGIGVVPNYADPGVHASATGVYTEKTLTFASSIDSALTSLTALYTHDNGVAALAEKMPLIVELHGYGGDATSITQTAARRAAARGFAVLRVNMRGRGGDAGTADDNGRELYDILDAIAAVESAHSADVDTTKIHLFGLSGGGWNTLGLVTKFPGLAITAVSCFGFGDVGLSSSRSFWALSAGDQSTIEGRVGERVASPLPYAARVADLTIAQAVKLAATKLVLLWDSADVNTFALHRETRNALIAGDAPTSKWYAEESTDGKWAHGYVENNPNLTQAENIIFNRRLEAVPSVPFPKVGTIDVGGYIVTPTWELWTGDTTDYDPRSGGLGGTKHRVRVDFDDTAGHFVVRALTGACNVVVRRRSNGLAIAKALAADGTATFDLDNASHLAECIIGWQSSFTAIYGPKEGDGSTPESGDAVVSWAERSGTGNNLAVYEGSPTFFTNPSRVLCNASGGADAFKCVDNLNPSADFAFAVVFSVGAMTNYGIVSWGDDTLATAARVTLYMDGTSLNLAVVNTAGTDVYATKTIALVSDQRYIAICERVSGVFKLTLNALSPVTVTPSGTLIGTRLTVGVAQQGNAEFFPFTGYVYGFARGAGRSLSAGERTRLYKFAQAVFGVV